MQPETLDVLIVEDEPRLILLDKVLPDGQEITLMEEAAVKKPGCSVIFITAASDMNTCSQAIRNGAFDDIIKPVSYKRLRNSLERFMQFVHVECSTAISIIRAVILADRYSLRYRHQCYIQLFYPAKTWPGFLFMCLKRYTADLCVSDTAPYYNRSSDPAIATRDRASNGYLFYS